MKGILIGIVAVLSMTLAAGQNVDYNIVTENDTITLQVDTDYLNHVADFKSDCIKYLIPLSKFKRLYGVEKSYGMRGMFGVHIHHPVYKSRVYINGTIPSYLTTFKKAVIYHELTHFILGQANHCEPLDKDCAYLFRPGPYINIEAVIGNFEYYRKQLMEYIVSELAKKP